MKHDRKRIVVRRRMEQCRLARIVKGTLHQDYCVGCPFAHQAMGYVRCPLGERLNVSKLNEELKAMQEHAEMEEKKMMMGFTLGDTIEDDADYSDCDPMSSSVVPQINRNK